MKCPMVRNARDKAEYEQERGAEASQQEIIIVPTRSNGIPPAQNRSRVTLFGTRARVVFAAPMEASDSRCEPNRSCYFFTSDGRIYVHSWIMFGIIETIPSCRLYCCSPCRI